LHRTAPFDAAVTKEISVVPTRQLLAVRNRPPANLVDALYDCAYSRSVDIEWDAKKAASNLRKHGIDFADAALVFEDDLALTRPDLHSHHEERFVTLGCDPQGRLMVVVTPGAESAFA
jgi:hypothetical protein